MALKPLQDANGRFGQGVRLTGQGGLGTLGGRVGDGGRKKEGVKDGGRPESGVRGAIAQKVVGVKGSKQEMKGVTGTPARAAGLYLGLEQSGLGQSKLEELRYVCWMYLMWWRTGEAG